MPMPVDLDLDLDGQDESVRIAVRALGDMRNGGGVLSPSPASGRAAAAAAAAAFDAASGRMYRADGRAYATGGSTSTSTSGSGSGSTASGSGSGSVASSSFQPTPALSVSSRSTSPSLRSLATDDDGYGCYPGDPVRTRHADGAREHEHEHEHAEEEEEEEEREQGPDFVSRVSHFPIVGSALRAYEQSKASSRVVKYGAEMMESSVRSISRPVIDRLPVNQLDEFACRQLDRFGSYGRPPSNQDSLRERSRTSYDSELDHRESAWTSALGDRGRGSDDAGKGWEYAGGDRDVHMDRDEDTSLAGRGEVSSRTPTPRQEEVSVDGQQQVVPRSRWQAVLLEAGGIGAAVSEESMRRLKYCLHWLQYATAHIDTQIIVLQDLIASLSHSSALSPSSSSSLLSYQRTPVSAQHLQTLTNIRKDVVDTIRQVVDVVSKYAGGALPEPARARVRSFILCLPQRWANAAGTGPGLGPAAAAAAEEPQSQQSQSQSQSKSRGRGKTKTEGPARTGRGRASASAPYSYGPGEAGPSPRSRPASPARAREAAGAGAVAAAAQRILTLAMESLDMLRAVTAVFKESLDKADAWVERLRVVGLQRHSLTSSSSHASSATPPPSSEHPNSRASGGHEQDGGAYRDPLPPIAWSPGSSTAPSPSPQSSYVQLPSIASPSYRALQQNEGQSQRQQQEYQGGGFGFDGRTGEAASEMNALSLREEREEREGMTEGCATPKSGVMRLPPEGDGGGGEGRGAVGMEVDG